MAVRLRRSQRIAQMRIPFRNVREVAGTSLPHPRWPSAPTRSADLAIVLHLPDLSALAEYRTLITASGVDADVIVLIPDRPGNLTNIMENIEILPADAVGAHWYQLVSLLNSGRIIGYRTVVRHIHQLPSDIERFRAIDLGSVDTFVHSNTRRAGVVYSTTAPDVAVERNASYRAAQLLKRISTRRRAGELPKRVRLLETVALRGAALEMLRTLRIDHQDFFTSYPYYVNEGQAEEKTKAGEADDFAPASISAALQSLLDAADLQLHEPTPSITEEPAVAGVKRAVGWAIYHPDLCDSAPTRDTTWTRIAGSMPMYLGQQVPLVPGALGFSDPRNADDRAKQVRLAAEAGIEGFLVPVSWGVDGLSQREFFDSLAADEPFPWAIVVRHPVAQRIDPVGSRPILTQWLDPGVDRYAGLAAEVAALAARGSYLRYDERPVVLVEDLSVLADAASFIGHIRRAFVETLGVEPWVGVVEVALTTNRPGAGTVPALADGVVQIPPINVTTRQRLRIGGRFGGFSGPVVNLAASVAGSVVAVEARVNESIIPGAFVGFDSTPELRAQGTVGYNWNVATFRRMLEGAVTAVASREPGKRIVVINSWNGWADLSQLEPGHYRGHAYLSAVKDALHF